MRVLTYTAILLFSFTFSAIAGDSFLTNKHASANAFLSQRTTAVSKASCPTAAQARIKTEKANPGWRVDETSKENRPKRTLNEQRELR